MHEPLSDTQALAPEVIATMRALAAEFAEGNEITRSAALEKANNFFGRTFAGADEAWGEVEAFGDDFEAILEK